MKIGITCYPTYGGSGVLATELGKALAKRGHQIHFISYAMPMRLNGGFDNNIFYHEVEMTTYPVFEFPLYTPALASKMVEVANFEGLDLLHVHYAIPHATSAYLAKKMIRLSGLVEDKDIKITFTGLRPGEKIYEELLNDKENTVPTYHPQIMIAKVRSYDYNEVNNKIEKLLESVNTYDNYNVVAQMKEIVPEFISANSVYEKLDKKD
jgi:glycosyltransferase involved in cell wall biosynthesis